MSRKNCDEQSYDYIEEYKGFDICQFKRTGEIVVFYETERSWCYEEYVKGATIEEVRRDIDEGYVCKKKLEAMRDAVREWERRYYGGDEDE